MLNNLDTSEKEQIKMIKKDLIGKKRTTMAHVGGIVFDIKTNIIKSSINQYIDILEEDKKSIS